MARPRNARTPDIRALARLKIDPDLILEGGIATLQVWVREDDTLHQPLISLWLDPVRHVIKAHTIVSPSTSTDNGRGEALAALIQACTRPFTLPELPMPSTPLALTAGVNTPDLANQIVNTSAMPTTPTPALPARIRVNDAQLADTMRTVFEPLGVDIEYAPELPKVNEALTELTEAMGGPQNEPPRPFEWDLSNDALEPLFAAAAAYWRRKPWEYLDDYPPVVIQLGENGPRPDVPALYASILGAAEEVFGVALYYSADALDSLVQRGEEMLPPLEIEDALLDELAQMLQASGVPIEDLSRADLRSFAGELMGAAGLQAPTADQARDMVEDSLTVFFSPASETDPTYLEWIAAHNLKYPSKQGVPSFLSMSKQQEHGRLPNEREARALTLALDALAHFCKMHRRSLESGPGPFITMQKLLGMPETEMPVLDAAPVIELGGARIEVPVSYTMPLDMLELGDGEAEVEEPPPASATAPTTLYCFHVALEWKPDVWRRIEMRGDQTLEDLHYAIQEAFGWDDDHLYSFYLNGKAFDPRTEYCSPYADCERHVSGYRLENIDLRPRKKVLYLFDYGDELRHTVTVEAITKGGVEPRKKYPRIAERHGRRVRQYADW